VAVDEDAVAVLEAICKSGAWSMWFQYLCIGGGLAAQRKRWWNIRSSLQDEGMMGGEEMVRGRDVKYVRLSSRNTKRYGEAEMNSLSITTVGKFSTTSSNLCKGLVENSPEQHFDMTSASAAREKIVCILCISRLGTKSPGRLKS
jgi:hypothetical protein